MAVAIWIHYDESMKVWWWYLLTEDRVSRARSIQIFTDRAQCLAEVNLVATELGITLIQQTPLRGEAHGTTG